MLCRLCYAMLCYAMLCYAMLCYAMLCYAMLCYAMLCYAMLCYAMLCYAMLCYAMPKAIVNIRRGFTLASSVLPTPVGPRNMKLAIGRFGSDSPARDLRTRTGSLTPSLLTKPSAALHIGSKCHNRLCLPRWGHEA